jgi:hypothetical protein
LFQFSSPKNGLPSQNRKIAQEDYQSIQLGSIKLKQRRYPEIQQLKLPLFKIQELFIEKKQTYSRSTTLVNNRTLKTVFKQDDETLSYINAELGNARNSLIYITWGLVLINLVDGMVFLIYSDYNGTIFRALMLVVLIGYNVISRTKILYQSLFKIFILNLISMVSLCTLLGCFTNISNQPLLLYGIEVNLITFYMIVPKCLQIL